MKLGFGPKASADGFLPPRFCRQLPWSWHEALSFHSPAVLMPCRSLEEVATWPFPWGPGQEFLDWHFSRP